MQLQDFESQYSTRAAFTSQNVEWLLAMQRGLQVLSNLMTEVTEPDYRGILDSLSVAIRTAITESGYAQGSSQPHPSSEQNTAFNTTSIPGANDHVMHGYTQNPCDFHPQSSESRRNAGHTDHGDHGHYRQNRYSQESTQTQPEIFTMTGVNTPARQSPERYDRGRPDYPNGADLAQGMLLRNNMGGAVRPNYFESLGRPSQHDQRAFPESSRQFPLPANYPQLSQGPPVAPCLQEPHIDSSQGFQWQPTMSHEAQSGWSQQAQQGSQAAYMHGMDVAHRDETRQNETWQRQMQPTTDAHHERLREQEQMNREWLMSTVHAQAGVAMPDPQQSDPINIVGQVPRPPRTYVPGQGPHLRDIHPAYRP